MATVRGRQLWIGGVEKWCEHPIIEEIKAEGGRVLAESCKACGLRLAEYGKCAGCLRDRRLTKFVLSKRKAYCSVDCYEATMRAERAAKAPAVQK
jgi:hypothetical protein